jgi:hypothetical protein
LNGRDDLLTRMRFAGMTYQKMQQAKLHPGQEK